MNEQEEEQEEQEEQEEEQEEQEEQEEEQEEQEEREEHAEEDSWDAENVTICITPKLSTTPECIPSSPTDEMNVLWSHVMLAEDSIAAPDSIVAPVFTKDQHQHQHGYETCTMKTLQHFAHYYKLSCLKVKGRKCTKEVLLNALYTFEANESNTAIVQRCRHVWRCLTDLKADAYFSKFVICTMLF
jgi:hypothetical protein